MAKRPRGLGKSPGLHTKDGEKGTLHGKHFKLLQMCLLSFTSFHFRISPNTFHMSACSKPYSPETKTEEIDLGHLYELWSKCVLECFWCYALRSLVWAFLPEMRHTWLPLDSTHVSEADSFYHLPAELHELWSNPFHKNKHFHNIWQTRSALYAHFFCFWLLCNFGWQFQNGDCWIWEQSYWNDELTYRFEEMQGSQRAYCC